MSSCSSNVQLNMASKFAHAMRSVELALAMPLLPPGGRILELGAGDGWQASLLAQNGFVVSAVDIASAVTGTNQYAPVTIYDGLTLPFSDGSFDAVYSSNVLEHVQDFDRIQAEIARVLTHNGVAVHCVPSATWRFWTTLGHPFYVLRWIWKSHQNARPSLQHPRAQPVTDQPPGKHILRMLRLGLIAPRHGEQGNLVSEHYLFSRHGWSHRFTRVGWQITAIRPTGLFYSGNELLSLRMSTRIRCLLAKLLGSSTNIFVLHPRSHRS